MFHLVQIKKSHFNSISDHKVYLILEHHIVSKQQQQKEKAMATAMPSNDTTSQPPKDKDSSSKKVNQWLHTYANVTKTNPNQQKPKNQTTRDQRKSNTYTFFNLMTAENITDQIIRELVDHFKNCLLYTSPSPRDATLTRMPSSA